MQTDAAAAFAAAQAQYKQTFEKHLANGVNFMSDQVWIDPEVEIAPGATILPGCILRGNTKIGAGCVVIYFCKEVCDASVCSGAGVFFLSIKAGTPFFCMEKMNAQSGIPSAYTHTPSERRKDANDVQ